MATLPIAVQMYTLRDETEKDFIGTLRKVAKIGYAGAEFAGYGNLSAKELKTVLDDLGLKPAGAHVGIEEYEANLAGVIDFQLEIGNKFIACPWLAEERRKNGADWKQLAEKLSAFGQEFAKHGITLCYHNHDFEFQRFDGQYGLDILYGNSDPKYLQAELDLYWVKKGGEDPTEYVKKFSGRLPLLHIKDMATDGSFAEFGNGTLNWDTIIPAAQQAGTQWYIVEQDVCTRPCLESVEISFRNLQARGLA